MPPRKKQTIKLNQALPMKESSSSSSSGKSYADVVKNGTKRTIQRKSSTKAIVISSSDPEMVENVDVGEISTIANTTARTHTPPPRDAPDVALLTRSLGNLSTPSSQRSFTLLEVSPNMIPLSPIAPSSPIAPRSYAEIARSAIGPSTRQTTNSTNLFPPATTRALQRGKMSEKEADLLVAHLVVPDELVDDVAAGLAAVKEVFDILYPQKTKTNCRKTIQMWKLMTQSIMYALN